MMPADLDAVSAVLVSWLLTYAMHSTILLAVAAAIAWRFAEQHEWLDLVWKAALVGPLVTAGLQSVMASPLNTVRWSIADVAPTVAEVRTIVPAPRAHTPAAAPTVALETSSPAPAPERAAAEAHGAVAVADASPRESASTRIDAQWPLLIVLAWIAIAFAAVVRYLFQLRTVYGALAAGTPIEKAGVAGMLGDARGISVTMNTACLVPLAMAGRRIVVPHRLLTLAADAQRAALAHEAAHIVRRDPEWRIAMDLLERVLFFQPLNRFARARLCDTAEFLCDQWAVSRTGSPLAMARCLSEVASWAEGHPLAAGVSAMARSDSALIKRVTRILDGASVPSWRPRVWWVAIPVVLVSIAAPRVSATRLADAVVPREAPPAATSVLPEAAKILAAGEKAQEPPRSWTPRELARARAQLQVTRPPAGGTLAERWQWALSDAGRRGLNDFWIVYAFDTPIHADGIIISDWNDGSMFMSKTSRSWAGPSFSAMFDDAVMLEGGNLAVLVHYRGARAGDIDRAGYRSASVSYNFGRTPVFWLGSTPAAQSFERVRELFGQVRGEKLQVMMLELASMHPDSNAVIPFLTGLVDPSRSAVIREEAAEGFAHHADPRSVDVLLRVARTDVSSTVRAEAAETIGEVQTPEAIPALTDLARESPDDNVRREAAEGFGEQPAARALPAIEGLVANIDDDGVLAEAIEALGEIDDPAAVPLLVQIANEHASLVAQQEAVETLGDRQDDAAAIAAIERIARSHPREEVQAEAIETLADVSKGAAHPALLDLAVTGASPRLRREALESIGDAVSKSGDALALDAAVRVIAGAIFDDPDTSVRLEAIDTLDDLPSDRAQRVLRDVIARHPDARIRREAEEHLRERQ